MSLGRLRQFSQFKLPTTPNWSVKELLASYPRPVLSNQTLDHLHRLSALVPPTEGSAEQAQLKEELEDLVRMVEAVKLVDTTGVEPFVFTNRRDIYESQEVPGDIPSGRELMKHAVRTDAEFYVVDTNKTR